MKSVALTAYPRSLTRRGGAKKLRTAGRIPAVVYGRRHPPQNIEVKAVELETAMQHSASENILVDLKLAEDARPERLVLVQEIQHQPLTGGLLHVDFHEVAADEKVTITVPVESVGEAIGVKASGGILEHVLFKLKLRGLPKDLPEVLEVDVTHLDIGQSIHIGELKAPPGVEILGDKKIPVLAVAAPVTEAEEAAAEAAAAAAPTEVEVLREKKEESAEGAAAAAAPVKGAEKATAEKPAAEKKPEKKK
jgi:large subunit ribosomal protein L25